MIRDYKFRQGDLSFRTPKRAWYKRLRWAVGLALVVGLLYDILYLGFPSPADSDTPARDADIIPLPLPRHDQPKGRPPPVAPDHNLPMEGKGDRNITETWTTPISEPRHHAGIPRWVEFTTAYLDYPGYLDPRS
jgi:hypothetical protein